MERYWQFFVIVLVSICLVLLMFNFSQLRYSFDSEMLPHYQVLPRQPPFNLTRCNKLKGLRKILLAVNYNWPHYSSIPLLKKLYGEIFGKIVFCGSTDHIDVIKIDEFRGYLGYDCVGAAIRMFPDTFAGYFYINDDVLLNWWNLMSLDITQIWTGTKIDYTNGHEFGELRLPEWHWWRTLRAAEFCEAAFEKINKLALTKEGGRLNLTFYLQRYFRNTNDRKLCVHHWSDVVYIPKEHSQVYARLSGIYAQHRVFLEVAVPGILAFLLNKTNTYNLNGLYYHQRYGYSPKFNSGEAFYETYSFDVSFSHPLKLDGEKKVSNWNFVKNVVIPYGENVKHYCSIKKH